MCSCDSGDGPKVFERVLRKARPLKTSAPYQCCECAREIKRGDWYEEVAGLWGERWDKFRTCLRCTARRMAWTGAGPISPFESLNETIYECMVDDPNLRRVYKRALREARRDLKLDIEKLELARSEHYAIAGQKREAKKKILAWLGDGI